MTLTRDLALEQAHQADDDLKAGHDRGPLHGIPYGAKDLLATRGIPTTWGAEPFRNRVIDQDATVITRLRDAGAVLCAKLSMVELAGGMGYHQPNASLTGPGLNPWNLKKWSGGSSSGSGSAVAAGLVPFAIGTETWGSITTPASYCGLTGLRPTYGRVSRSGAMALAWTHDKIGPMAHSAHDCGVILNAIAGPDPDDPSASDRPYQYPPADDPGRPYKLAVLKDGVEHAQPEVRKNFERALKEFEKLGTIEEVELPDLPFADVAVTIISAEGSAAFEEMFDSGSVLEPHRPRGPHRRLRRHRHPRHRVPPRPAHPGQARPRSRRLLRPLRRRPHRPHRRRRHPRRRLPLRPLPRPLPRRPRQRLRHPRPRHAHRPDRRRPPHLHPARRPRLLRKPPAGPRPRLPERHRLAPATPRPVGWARPTIFLL